MLILPSANSVLLTRRDRLRWSALLLIYRLLLPLLFIAAFPGWILKMLRRGGFGTRLGERAGIYTTPQESEPRGAVHLHAVSVGESLLALKLIRKWREQAPEQYFVLATGTATGHAVATAADIPGLRVTYAPLDLPSMVSRYIKHFGPKRIVLIEGEAWPHLLLECNRRSIPVTLVNARMSPRSSRRYRRFATWLQPVFSMLEGVAIQEPEDAEIWRLLGVDACRIHHTGSLKFDPDGGSPPTRRLEFQRIFDTFGKNRPVVLAASTHSGEDAWVASAIREAAPHALPVIAPRHAERRAEVEQDLKRAGFHGILRSKLDPTAMPTPSQVLVIDSTGELRDWTAHADVVVIGKSFFSTGGQNPTEAIQAKKPVIFGSHMENFEPLASRLIIARGCIRAVDQSGLIQAIRDALIPATAAEMTRNASQVLACHQGATQRILALLTTSTPSVK